MSLQTFMNNVAFWPGTSSSDELAIRVSLQEIYINSAAARTMIEAWLPSIVAPLYFQSGTEFAAAGNVVQCNMVLLPTSSYIDLSGKAVLDTLTSALAHELGHVCNDGEDNNTPTLVSDNVTFVNQIFGELGFGLQRHYLGYSNEDALTVNFNYTNGAQVDVAWVARTGQPNLFTTSNGGLRDLLIGDVSNNNIRSGAGDDFLYGGKGTGADVLIGGEGKDFLDGGDGNDVLIGDEAALGADGSVESTTSDQTTDLLQGGIGADKYYVNDQFIAANPVVKGNEVALAAKLDLIRDEDGLGTVYVGTELWDISGVILRPNTNPNIYGDFISESPIHQWVGGKIVGNEIIIGYFDYSGFESSVSFKIDIGASLPQAPALRIDSAAAASSLSTSTGPFLGMTFATALNQVVGTAAAQTLTGTANADYVRGLGGIDTINAGDGDDVIDGGDGNDIVHGNAGSDDIIGELGNDTLYGDDGFDYLKGGSGNDVLFGGLANDRLSGELGDDQMSGGGGLDSMTGGDGNDTYTVSRSTDVVVEYSGASSGTDTVISDTATWTLGDNFENLTLRGTVATYGTDAITGNGNALNNVIKGQLLNNVLSGAVGNDTISGGLGNDRLSGGAGNDIFKFDTALNATTTRTPLPTTPLRTPSIWRTPCSRLLPAFPTSGTSPATSSGLQQLGQQ